MKMKAASQSRLTMNYQEGDFLLHDEHGIGKIVRVVPGDPADLTVDFERSPNFTMSARLADRTTRRLAIDGFKALAYEDHTEAMRLIKEAPAYVVALVLRDFPNHRAKQEEIKDDLARYVKDWPEWWKRTQIALKDAPYIDTSNSKLREYGLREAALSRSDEAFDHFQRLRRKLTQPESKTTSDDVYEQARLVLNTVKEAAHVPERMREVMFKYFRDMIDDEALDTERRLDATFRLLDVDWLTPAEGHAVLEQLHARDLKLYRLGTFAQNRLLDLLLQPSPSPAELRILLTGLCAEPPVVDRVLNWLLKQGSSVLLERGLFTALAENLPPDLPVAKYEHFGYRLKQLTSLVDVLPGETIDWRLIIERTGTLTIKMAKEAPRASSAGEFPHMALVLLCGVVYRRVQGFGPEYIDPLIEAVADPTYSTGFTLALLDAADSTSSVSPDFSLAIREHLFQQAGEQHDALLDALLGQPIDEPVARMAAIVDAAEHHHNVFVLDWAGDQANELCRSVDDHTLLQMLRHLDRLSRLGEDRPWQSAIDAFRERGYLAALRQNIPPHGGVTVVSPGALDQVIVRAMREYIDERNSTSLHEREAALVRITVLDQRVQDLANQLAERGRLLGELRSGMVQGGDSTRFEERIRILRDLATTVAEIERFAYRQGKPSLEVDGILRRLHSVIKGQRIVLLDAPGTSVAFNPEQQQLIDQIAGTTPTTVVVVERGYLVTDPQGLQRLLKPALVKAAPSVP